MVITRSPFSGQPLESTPFGDQKKFEFISDLLHILGDTRLLWMPDNDETTTSTDLSRLAATITYNATFADQYSQLGSGLQASFDAAADEADVPYDANFFFGDGVTDTPFSVVAVVSANDVTPTAAATILAVFNKDTDGEQRHWRVHLSATNGYPTIESYDESANAYIGRQDQTALADTNPHLLVFTYSGSKTNAGFNVFVDAADLDDADSTGGSYGAQEDPGSAEKLLLGHTLSAAGTPVAEEFWDGNMALVALCAKELTQDEAWAIKNLVNAYFDLSL